MSYLGYRVIIGSTTITNDLIQKGTYEFTKEKRMAASWNDANNTEHHELNANRKVKISFSLRERTLEEQTSLVGIFATQENVIVTYWDDYDCTYKTGTFYMNAPKINHRNTIDTISYAPTVIQLVEY